MSKSYIVDEQNLLYKSLRLKEVGGGGINWPNDDIVM